jgi:hypothetical protein
MLAHSSVGLCEPTEREGLDSAVICLDLVLDDITIKESRYHVLGLEKTKCVSPRQERRKPFPRRQPIERRRISAAQQGLRQSSVSRRRT